MPSRLKDEVFREIEAYELVGMPEGTTILMYIEAVVEGVDKGIQPFVRELMLLGYPTYTSCSGGPGHITVSGGMGFVTINQDLTPDEVQEIRQVARRNKLKDVRIENLGEDMSRVVFKPKR